MSWLYLPERAADCLAAGCSDGERSVMSNATNTVLKCSRLAFRMDVSMMLPSGTMFEPSTGVPGLDQWILSLRDSRASRSVERAGSSESMTPATFGRTPFALFEKSGPNGFYWRMSQGCFPALMFDEFSETWPRAGTMRNGIAYRRAPLAPLTSEIGSGLWPTPVVSRGDYVYSHGWKALKLAGAVKMFPTPTANDARQRFNTSPGSNHPRPNLAAMAKYDMFPTPVATNWKNRTTCEHSRDLQKAVGGMLNPDWEEWLMGWPIGWTALQPLETGKFRQWLELHGNTC